MKRISLTLLSLSLLTAISCDKDDDSSTTEPTVTLPETYDFENVSYTGQENRLDMLSEIVTYMKTANSGDNHRRKGKSRSAIGRRVLDSNRTHACYARAHIAVCADSLPLCSLRFLLFPLSATAAATARPAGRDPARPGSARFDSD